MTLKPQCKKGHKGAVKLFQDNLFLKHLPEPEQNEITVTELCKRIGCEKQTARAALNRLYEQGLIDRRLVGGLYIYRRKNETKE